MTALLLATILWGAPLPFPKAKPLTPFPVGSWVIEFRHGKEDAITSTIEFAADGTGQLWNHGEPSPKPFYWSLEDTWIGIKDVPEEERERHLWGIRVNNVREGDATVAGIAAKLRRLR